MKNLLVTLLLMFGASALLAEEACPKLMSTAVEAKLTPVLKARAAALRLKNEWDRKYHQAFEKLLSATDKASQEARVALMDYYIGEHYGAVLVCAVARDTSDVRTLLELYSLCDIRPTSSVLQRDRWLPLREDALKLIRSGEAKERCTYE